MKAVAVLVGIIVLGGLAYFVLGSGPASVTNQNTINECRPGESPTTHLCYDPSLPS